uniref:Differentially expressed in FDCP 6 homolog n=1 Tax=Nicotiana sylvestris TaxID=4096 RepID=A0A1U7WI92_NICSY|nr:PREDICTED: differentially expressed in FDCP 6 homolog [Nicotiana sylvestris]
MEILEVGYHLGVGEGIIDFLEPSLVLMEVLKVGYHLGTGDVVGSLKFNFPLMEILEVGYYLSIGEPFEARSCSFGEGEGLPAPVLKSDNNKREMFFQGDGAQGKAKRDWGIKAEASSEPAMSVAFDKLKSGLLRGEASLRKALDEERSLRLLCDEKEVELKKMEALEHLRDKVSQARREYDELRARAEAQALEGKDALAIVPSFEAQLFLAHNNASIQTDMIAKLESELLKVRDEIVDARAEATMSRTKADRERAIYSKDVVDAQAELRRFLDREGKVEEYAR